MVLFKTSFYNENNAVIVHVVNHFGDFVPDTLQNYFADVSKYVRCKTRQEQGTGTVPRAALLIVAILP